MRGEMAVETPELTVRDASAWRAWLDENHREQGGVWLVLAKKGTTEPTSLTYDEALEEALCHGWIDGQTRRRDDATYLQRFTPRRPKSIWSQVNRDHVARLAAAGRMTPHGQKHVDAAKADGRWDAAYAPIRSVSPESLPADLRASIEVNPRARKTFATLNRTNLFALAFRTNNMKTPAGRAKKIAELVAMLARGETIVPNGQRKLRR